MVATTEGAGTDRPIGLPEACVREGWSIDRVRRLLRKRPDLDRGIVRIGGQRALTRTDVDALRGLMSEHK